MIVAVAKERLSGERRVALVPDGVKALAKAGLELRVEAGAGEGAGYRDADYAAAGARVEADRAALLAAADLLLGVQSPDDATIAGLREGTAVVALLRPLDEPERARALAARRLTAFSLELVPRITRAQAMDVLSSQATVAGYRAVLLAALRLPKLFPMLVTAAGTITAARAFVIGAGVAGLQAIATAKRLGAIVEAYDVRAAAAEQIESLGGRFVSFELETRDAQDAGGYAKAQSEEFYAKQRAFMAAQAARSDVVIATALVPGRRAPVLLDEAGVRGMKPGSVVVDLAAPNGGNCACTRPDEEVVVNGVHVLGPTNLASEVSADASRMFSRNVVNLVSHLVKEGKLALDREDEITQGTLVTLGGEVVHPVVQKHERAARGGVSVRGEALAEGFLAAPDDAPHPGAVVIPDVWGLSDHTRDIAQRLAREGFAALALDVYRKTGRPSLADPAAAMAWIRELSDPRVLETVQEGIDTLARHPAVAARKVGLIGFCMGGQYAWLAACTCRGLSAVAPFYGMLRYEPGLDPQKKPRAPLDAVADLSCPALGLYGQEDAIIPNADVDELEARLARQRQPYEIVRYAGAGHAFLNDTRPALYRPEAAADAWRRLVAFLRARLA